MNMCHTVTWDFNLKPQLKSKTLEVLPAKNAKLPSLEILDLC